MPSKKRASHVCVVKVPVFSAIFEIYNNKTSKYHPMLLLKCFPRTICVNKIISFFQKNIYNFSKTGAQNFFWVAKKKFRPGKTKKLLFFPCVGGKKFTSRTHLKTAKLILDFEVKD